MKYKAQYRKPFYMKIWVFAKHFFTAPFIFGMAVPLVFLDVCMEVYHRICFPIYKMPYVKRGDYIRIDRHKLSYLKWYDKLFCAYCGYANGLIQYVAAIAGKTEEYWCGIRHKKYEGFHEPPHHKEFAEYNNEDDFKKKYL